MTELSIPLIDVAALFGGPSGARDRTDEAIMAAATTFGFFAAGGLPADVPIDATGHGTGRFLRTFSLRRPLVAEHDQVRRVQRHAIPARALAPLEPPRLGGVDFLRSYAWPRS
jgi:hypothetical protein